VGKRKPDNDAPAERFRDLCSRESIQLSNKDREETDNLGNNDPAKANICTGANGPVAFHGCLIDAHICGHKHHNLQYHARVPQNLFQHEHYIIRDAPSNAPVHISQVRHHSKRDAEEPETKDGPFTHLFSKGRVRECVPKHYIPHRDNDGSVGE
jgi:hypothetical protein